MKKPRRTPRTDQEVRPTACILCGSQDYRRLFTATDTLYRTTEERFQVVRCAACGLTRIEPRPSPDELAKYYPGNYWFAPDASAASRLQELYRRLVLRDHVRFVLRALRRSGARGPVLDVGCGGGLFLRMLAERGRAVVGLDVSCEAAGVAWRNGVPVVCGSLDRAPLAPGSFAAVTMFHVLEHVADPRAYLEAARTLLAPQGRLIVQTPNAACWQFKLLGRAWTGIDVPRHLTDFRARDLERLLDACGFAVLGRKHFSLRDNPAGLASSLVPWLDPMARRVRRIRENGPARLAKDMAYLALVIAAAPFAAVEAAFGAGSTVMMEAVPV